MPAFLRFDVSKIRFKKKILTDLGTKLESANCMKDGEPLPYSHGRGS